MREVNDLPDLELLGLFAALHRERHLTRAALSVGKSQPAMSRAVDRMRRVFGDPLFVRTPRGMVPTARADALAPEVQRVLESARALVRNESFDPATLSRAFVIATSDLVEAHLLAALSRKLHERAPNADLLVRPIGPETEADLTSGRVDIAIAPDEALSKDLVRQHLFDDSFVCAVRDGHPKVRRTLSLETYVELLHVQIAPRGTSGGPIDSALASRGLARRVAVRTASFLAAPILVSRSDYVITAPKLVLEPLAKSLGLRLLPTPLEVAGFRIFQGWHPRAKADPVHRWFRALVVEVARG